jgi:hypothetical protein
MRLDSLVRLIESSDFSSFREIALAAISLKGYAEPSLADGWNDGGSDVRVSQVPPNPTKLAIQISVKKKLAVEAER